MTKVDALVKATPYGDCRNNYWAKAINLARELEKENIKLRNEIEALRQEQNENKIDTSY